MKSPCKFISALTAFLCISMGPTIGQNTSPSGSIAAKHPSDIILVRRVLMAEIGRNMDALVGMTEPGGKFDAGDAGEHADTIAAMLSVFPHLFPPDSDIWSKEAEEKDPASVTMAKPELWQHFDEFFASSQEAAQVALKAAYSKDEAEFRSRYPALQPQCDACHAAFRREEGAYVIPIPGPAH